MVKEELEKMLLESVDGLQRNPLVEMREAIGHRIESINVCVCSFSEVGDLLSQWRAYSGGAGGFSIGFGGEFLKAASRREDFWLVPCVYDEDDQRALVRNLLSDVCAS